MFTMYIDQHVVVMHTSDTVYTVYRTGVVVETRVREDTPTEARIQEYLRR